MPLARRKVPQKLAILHSSLKGNKATHAFAKQPSMRVPNMNAVNWHSYSFAHSIDDQSAYVEYGVRQGTIIFWQK